MTLINLLLTYDFKHFYNISPSKHAIETSAEKLVKLHYSVVRRVQKGQMKQFYYFANKILN